ncbi:unnamed protein product [Arctia plantaginis]|uniref:GST N-terminal domain-containing protein n=1 Tax=Arctia plantaginis TaxID=874455 RepID=A0A8S0ZXG7_ARCPL|nr:unnamed protein product [Arctia plantaginis]
MAAEKGAILYAYWLSSCSWRVRAALTLKKIPFEERTVDIVKEKKQFTEDYRAINPAQKVPALAIDNVVLVESMAIIQYLEETRPQPALIPKTPLLRARMREICEIVVSGIQPLQNFGLKPQFETEDQFQKFTKHFSERGLPLQFYNAYSRYSLDSAKYPTISEIYNTLLQHEVFQKTHPKNVKPKK